MSYIVRSLADAYQAALPTYRQGLGEVNRLTNARFGQPFPELGEAEQDAVLADIEASEAEAMGQRGRGTGFFELVRRHVLEGVFGEPQYGGNRDMVGWRLVGFGGQLLGYPDAYINRVVDIGPVADDSAAKDG